MDRRSSALWLLSLACGLLPSTAQAAHRCFPEPLFCGETRRAALDATECFLDEESWADFYTFTGPAGREVTITLTSDTFTPSLFLFSPQPALAAEQDGSGSTVTLHHTLESGGEWRIGATTVGARDTGLYTITLECSTPDPPAGTWLTTPEVPGFRFKVRITAQSSIAGARVADCIEDTLCVSGAVPGRAEIFLRVVGPRPNGYLWPTLVKLTTSQVEVWIEQEDGGQVRYYLLPGATSPTSSELPGFFDRTGFLP